MQFIKIDKEFQSLLRPLTAEEFESLEDSIKEDGCLRPIELWNGFIADGHNRYTICMKNGITFNQADITEKFATKSDVMKWIVQNQRARQTGRQLSKTELVEMALAVEKQVAVEAAEKMQSTLKQNAASSNLNERNEPIRTASKAAESIGVSENTYRDMKLVAEKGSEEQIERMNKGGRGNAPSTIAKEIRPEKVKKTFQCRKCGKIFPISDIRNKGRGQVDKICKDCRNAEDYERNENRRLEGTEGFYVDSVEEKLWTPEEIVEQMERDFDSYIDGLKMEIAIHRKEIRMHESVLDDAIDKFLIRLRSVKGEYR